MIITEVTEIGLEHVSEDHKTKNGIGICFFDPKEEALLEFNPNTTIPIYPNEKSYRKFFIVRDNISLNFNTVILQAETDTSDYTVKIMLNKTDDVAENNTLLEFFSNYPNGIIPFYIYIESNTTSYLETNLKLILEVK